MALNDKEKFE